MRGQALKYIRCKLIVKRKKTFLQFFFPFCCIFRKKVRKIQFFRRKWVKKDFLWFFIKLYFVLFSRIFIGFWRLYPQNFRNLFYFYKKTKLEPCFVCFPQKNADFCFGLFLFFLWEILAENIILNHWISKFF